MAYQSRIRYNLELSLLQELREHQDPAITPIQANAQEVVYLFDELKYWMRKVSILMDAQETLLGKHSEVLLKYDIAASRHLGDGWMILYNMKLKEELALYQPRTRA